MQAAQGTFPWAVFLVCYIRLSVFITWHKCSKALGYSPPHAGVEPTLLRQADAMHLRQSGKNFSAHSLL